MYILVYTSVVEGQFGGQDVKLFSTKKAAVENLQLQYNDVCDTFDAHGDEYYASLNIASAYIRIEDKELVWVIFKR